MAVGQPPPKPPVPPVPLSLRIRNSFKNLVASAAALNEASTEFNRVVAPLDEVLQRLNLGVECWVRFKTRNIDETSDQHHEVGYAKTDRRWGVAVRSIEEDKVNPEYTRIEQWTFNDAPRAMRVEAVHKVPELLDELTKKADKTARKLKEGTQTARDVIDALERAAADAGVLKAKKGAAQ